MRDVLRIKNAVFFGEMKGGLGCLEESDQKQKEEPTTPEENSKVPKTNGANKSSILRTGGNE